MEPPDLFKSYREFVGRSEAPGVYHRWSLIGCIAANLGRQFYLPFGEGKIHPNLYLMLIGEPGARKSSAIKLASKILAETGYDKFSAEKTSKEKFLADLAGQGSADSFDLLSPGASEVFINSDEFNEFVGTGNIEFLSLLGALWDFDSEKPFSQRLKNSKPIEIYQPTLNILAGNTGENLARAIPAEALGQGFASRLIFIHSEPSGVKIPFPSKAPAELREAVVRILTQMKLEVCGEASLDLDAKEALAQIYTTFTDLEDYRLKHYSSRRHTQLLKLCLIFAASRVSTTISLVDVIKANTVLSYAERSMHKALGEIGKSKNAEVSSAVLKILYETMVPVGALELFKQLATEVDGPGELNKILGGLLLAGRIQQTGNGYLPVVKTSRSVLPYTNPVYLKGYEIVT
jgi:DNA repair protein RadC